MAYSDWKKRTTAFERYLPRGYHAMAELVARAAYKAGERDGRKQGDLSLAKGTAAHEANRQAGPDANVEAVREKLLQRSIVGLKKYGVTTDRTDLSELDWLRHAQEEAMDFCIYLEIVINGRT